MFIHLKQYLLNLSDLRLMFYNLDETCLTFEWTDNSDLVITYEDPFKMMADFERVKEFLSGKDEA